MKQKTIADEKGQIHVIEGELSEGAKLEQEFEIPEGAEIAAVLVETLSGSSNISVEGLADEELSGYDRIKLRISHINTETKSLVLRITTNVNSKMRITIAFLKKKTSELPCKLCKEFCRLSVSALLANFGIPYLEADVVKEMPDILPLDEMSDKFTTDISKLGVDPNSTVPVQIGKPVKLSDNCINYLSAGENAQGLIAELFDSIHPQMIVAIRTGFEAVEWFFDAKDTLYTKSCEFVGFCKPSEATSS